MSDEDLGEDDVFVLELIAEAQKNEDDKLRVTLILSLKESLPALAKVIKIIEDNVLAKTPPEGEAKAFFVKMIGDYYRYVSESAYGDELERVKQAALEKSQEATDIELEPCNPIRLGLALNFSVFHYEVMKNQTAAIELAD